MINSSYNLINYIIIIGEGQALVKYSLCHAVQNFFGTSRPFGVLQIKTLLGTPTLPKYCSTANDFFFKAEVKLCLEKAWNFDYDKALLT